MDSFPLGRFSVARVGLGAIQLPGPGAFGPPRDRDAALAVLRRAVELGVNHIDTAQFYGPNAPGPGSWIAPKPIRATENRPSGKGSMR